MVCYLCKKLITDDHFIKTKRRHYYHLDECWWKVKKFYFVLVPLIFSIAFLLAVPILILQLIPILQS